MRSGRVLLALVLVSIFASSLTGHDPNQMTLADRLQGPSGEYLLGTDQLGLGLPEPAYFRGAHFVVRRSGGDHAARRGCGADRRHRGVHRRQADLLVQRFRRMAWMSFPPAAVADHQVDRRAGLLQIIVILGVSSGISNSTGGARSGHRHQGERLLPGGSGHWRAHLRDPAAARTAQHHGAHHRDLLDNHRRHHRGGGVLELLRVRPAARGAELGGMRAGKAASTWRWRRGWRSGRACA